LPVITLSSCGSILNLALDTLFISLLPKTQRKIAYAKSLSGGRVVDKLGFDQVGKVREGFGLPVSLNPIKKEGVSYILEDGLHESDSGLGRLNKLVLGLFDVEPVDQLWPVTCTCKLT
jgi:hypothetical protein